MANNQQPTVRLSFGPATRPPQAAPTPPSPPPSDSYYVFAENRSFGPVPSATIRQWITEKRVSGETQAQRAGSNEWKRIAEMPEFAGQVSTPPPSAISQPAATASATVDTYYIRTAERQYDPAPLSDIRRWITENRIPFDAMVRRVGTDEWKRIDELTATLAAQVAPSNVPIAEMTKKINQITEKLGAIIAALPNRDPATNAEETDTLGYLVPMIERAIQASPLLPEQKQQALNILQKPGARARDADGNIDWGTGFCSGSLFQDIEEYEMGPQQSANYLFANIQNWGAFLRAKKRIVGAKTEPNEFINGQVGEQIQLIAEAWADPSVLGLAFFVVSHLLDLKYGPPPAE